MILSIDSRRSELFRYFVNLKAGEVILSSLIKSERNAQKEYEIIGCGLQRIDDGKEETDVIRREAVSHIE